VFSIKSSPALGPIQPPIQSVPMVKRPEIEVTHLPVSSAEFKIECSYIVSALYVFTACNGTTLPLSFYTVEITYRFSSTPCGTVWCSWLRYRATRRKVAGSIPDGVIEIFH